MTASREITMIIRVDGMSATRSLEIAQQVMEALEIGLANPNGIEEFTWLDPDAPDQELAESKFQQLRQQYEGLEPLDPRES